MKKAKAFTILFGIVLMLSNCQTNYKELSTEEITFYNTEFFNVGSNNLYNKMLSNEYSCPGEIDLYQLFYNGIDGTADNVSKEELDLLTKMNIEAPNLDIIKVSREEMNNFLLEYLGISLDESQKKGLDHFYYLEEYDSYYVIVGDTNYEKCNITSGVWAGANKLILSYKKEYMEGEWQVTLEKKENGYLFISNQKVEEVYANEKEDP